jgi:hypothetical protein
MATNDCTGFQTTFRNCSRIAPELLKNQQKCPKIAPKIFVDELWRDVFAPIEAGSSS